MDFCNLKILLCCSNVLEHFEIKTNKQKDQITRFFIKIFNFY